MLPPMGRPTTLKALWFLFAPGAGAPSTSAWMSHYRELLANFGPVKTFDYDYMRAGKRLPDRAAALIERHRSELREGVEQYGPNVVLVGKSMGGRIGCHLALEEQVQGVICLGYPLKGVGKTGKLRDQVLFELPAPACFVQGTRDKLCPLELMQETLRNRKAPSHLHIVKTGDHSLQPTKTHLKQNKLRETDLENETMSFIENFLDSLTYSRSL